jgi:hypothetical protein
MFYLWLKEYGPEWTVERLKALKTIYLQHYAGNDTFRMNIEGISFHKNGSPKGPFRALWTMGNSRRVVNKCLSALMSYSSIIIMGRPTKKQWSKFHDAVVSPKPAGAIPAWDEPSLPGGSAEVPWEAVRELFMIKWDEAKYDKPSHWVNTEKKVLSFSHTHGLVKERECDLPLDRHIADFLLLCNSLLKEHSSRQLLAMLFEDFQLFHWEASLSAAGLSGSVGEVRSILTQALERPIVGSIGLIQERGCKLRAVANPLRVIQIALSRLKNLLEAVAKVLPWDCTHDQMAGISWAQEKLREGRVLYAFDLSNASDTIPLSDQLNMLRHMGPPNEWEFEAAMTLFEQVSRGDWKLPSVFHDEKYISWTKGQGLGIGCSFGAFALTHGLRLRQLEVRSGYSDCFVVLGDDVIVTADIAHGYHDLVTRSWGCEISAPKTITSGLLTEFASKVVTGHNQLKTFKYPKSSRMFETYDPTSLLVKFGKRALKIVPYRFRPTVQLISGLSKPFGLGWRWPERELLLPDPKDAENILMPIKREQVPDILPVEITRKKGIQSSEGVSTPGASYDSVIVRTKSYVEREQDLSVAFQSDDSPHVKLPGRKLDSGFKSTLLAEAAGLTVTSSLSTAVEQDLSDLVDIQHGILHVNSSREMESAALDDLADYVKSVVVEITGGRSSRNELAVSITGASPLTTMKDPIGTFEKKIRDWFYITWWDAIIILYCIKLGIPPKYKVIESGVKSTTIMERD